MSTSYTDGFQDPLGLDNCAREPIHVPGAVQPHGFLLALKDGDLAIQQASANVERYLGCSAGAVLKRPLSAFLRRTEALQLQRSLLADAHRGAISLKLSFTGADGGERPFDVTLHRQPHAWLLEAEPASSFDGDDFYLGVRASIAAIHNAETLPALLEMAARALRDVTGFDRVMVYRFDEAWCGEVVAEARAAGVDTFLGLWFPASDIPAQARELYRRTWLRHIPDGSYTPVPLVPVSMPGSGAPLDLSAIALRSVSPIHLEYLRNMGVAASLSASLLKEGRLWGLIACHHEAPRLVSPHARTACEILAQVISLRITTLENEASQAYREQIRKVQKQLLANVRANDDLVEGLVRAHPTVAHLINSDVGSVVIGDEIHRLGELPDEPATRRLAAWLRDQIDGDGMYHTDRLPVLFPEAEAYKAAAAGVVAARFGEVLILWLRPEVRQTVTWGGNPEKPVDASARITPRKSFEAWQQTVRLRCLPWEPFELEAVDEFRLLMQETVVGMTERRALRQLQELEDLKSGFMSAISHELRTPLNFIVSFASVLADEVQGTLNEQQHRSLGKILLGADQLLSLIDNLLDFARMEAGEFAIVRRKVDADAIAAAAAENLRGVAEEKHVELRLDPGGGTIDADPDRVTQVIYNLLANALKFTPAGGRIVLRTRMAGDMVRTTVEDTGPGIAADDLAHVFTKFYQAKGKEPGEGRRPRGSGLGLAIAKALVEAHGGQIGATSTLGAGSTFWFTLPRPREAGGAEGAR